MPKPHIDHVGIMVPDMDQALDLLKNLFNVEPSVIKEKEAIGLKLAMVEFENVNLELIQYTSPDSSFKPILGHQDGVNHVSIQVPDMDAAVARMEESGVQLAQGFPSQGSKGPLAFNRPATALGMLFELYQVKE